MKLMIVSDIHGSAYYCEQLLEAFAREQADKLTAVGRFIVPWAPQSVAGRL